MDKECSSCGQKDRCQEIYEKLGHSKGPNIALKAIFAFAVPVVAFIAAVAMTEPWLKAKIDNPKSWSLLPSWFLDWPPRQ